MKTQVVKSKKQANVIIEPGTGNLMNKFRHVEDRLISCSAFKNEGNGNSYVAQKSYKDKKTDKWENPSVTLFGQNIRHMIEVLEAVEEYYAIKLVPVTQYIVSEQTTDTDIQTSESEEESSDSSSSFGIKKPKKKVQ